MKIIDFYKYGNTIKLYLGKDDLTEWWGDDWDDAPYEHNAGEVYRRYVSSIMELAFPLRCEILEPYQYSYALNSPYSKEDMINRKIPCLKLQYNDKRAEIYFGDTIDDLMSALNGIQFTVFQAEDVSNLED